MADQTSVLSVRAVMDSGEYTRGAAAIAAANKEMASSGQRVVVSLTATDGALSRAGGGAGRLARIYVDGARSAAQFQSDLRALNTTLEAGKVSAEQAAAIYSGMVQKFGMTADGTAIASQGFLKLGAVIGQANTQMREFAQVSAAIETAAQELEYMTSRATALRAAIDPIGASQARLNRELSEYTTLLRGGAISAEEFAKAEVLARNRHDEFVASLNRTPMGAANDNNAQFRRQNLGYQAFDVGQTLALGMNPAMIAMQQGPQIAQIYAMQGGIQALKADLAAVGGVATRVATAIGPIGLAFLGVSAAATAFYFLTRKETKTTDEVLKEHAANIKALGDAYGIATDKARVYSETDKAIAEAATRTSGAELLAKQKQAIEDLSFTFGQIGGPGRGQIGFQMKGQFQDFFQAFKDLRSGGDIEKFAETVKRIGEEKGISDLADKILNAAKDSAALNAELEKTARLMREISADKGPGGFLLSHGPTNTADMGNLAAFQAQQAVAAQRAEQAFRAQIASIVARSPVEKANAAKDVAAAQYNNDETPAARAQRIELAGTQALITAQHELRQAQEDRQRQSQAALAQAQYEVSLIGKSVEERNRLIAAYQAEAAIREQAARNNVAADEKEIASARAKAAAVADLNAKASLGKLVEDQGYDAQRLQLEANLIGATADQRARATAQLEAEIRLKQQGIDTSSSLAQAYVQEQVALAQANQEIQRQQAAFTSLQQAGGSVIDDLITGTGSFEDRLKAAASDMLKWVTEMALVNPLKNQLTGTNLPTLADLFSGKPQVPNLTGATTGTMNVTAATVMINGAVPGALPGLPATNPFAGANATIPSNFTGTTPGLGASAVVRMQAAANQNTPSGDVIADVLAAKNASLNGSPLTFASQYNSRVDPRLTDILNQAALRTPGYQVQAFSGYRAGDPRFHGQGLATDVRLIDPNTGKILSNYQDPATFRTYEQFAQNAKMVQMDKYPELNDQFRWGGYFSGSRSKYGAMDEMHFDLGGSNKLGMAGGTWENGLTQSQRNLYPGVDSKGFNQLNQSMNKLSTTTTSTVKDISGLGDSTNKAASSVTDLLGQNGALSKAVQPIQAAPTAMVPTAPTTAGFNPFSIFTSLFSLFGFADGTDFAPGGMAMVGERGPELLRMPRGASITPNHKLNQVSNDNGPRSVTHKHEYNITVSGNGDKELMSRMAAAADEIARQHVEDFQRNGFGPSMDQYRDRPYERG